MRARATHHSAWFVFSLSLSLHPSSLAPPLHHNNCERLLVKHFVIAITVCTTDMFTSITTVVGL